MSIENKKFEKETIKNSESKENKRNFEREQKRKEIIYSKIETSESLAELEELIKKWIISKEIANKVKKWDIINEKEIKEIFKKIDEIEEIKNIDNYLPKELRITKEEYLKALKDKVFRIKTITKLNLALNFIADQLHYEDIWWINIFGSFLWLLDKNLIKIQENTIDIKDSLEKLNKTNSKDNNKTLWQKVLNFIKKLLKIKW
jgi:hypothetical protein